MPPHQHVVFSLYSNCVRSFVLYTICAKEGCRTGQSNLHILPILHYTVFTAVYTIHCTGQHALYTIQWSTLCSVQWCVHNTAKGTSYSVHYTVYTEVYTEVYTIQRTLYSVHYTVYTEVYTIQCTLYNVHWSVHWNVHYTVKIAVYPIQYAVQCKLYSLL